MKETLLACGIARTSIVVGLGKLVVGVNRFGSEHVVGVRLSRALLMKQMQNVEQATTQR